MNPFELLGVGRDADEREIRRAYTAKLRHTRPDDDPEGFQRLHEAYQRLLQIRRHQASQPPAPTVMATDGPAAPPAGPRPMPASIMRTEPVVLPPSIDIDAFCSEAFGRAAAGDEHLLSAWLHEQPGLWSFRAKAHIGQQLVRRLYREEPAMPTACLHVLLNFFDLDHVHAGHNALALQRLTRRSQFAWELMPEHRPALAARMGMHSAASYRQLERCLVRLQHPYTWWRALAAGFTPNSAKVMPQFIRELAGSYTEDLPPSVSQEQIRFWASVSQKQPVSSGQLLFMAGVLLMLSLVVALGAAVTALFSSQTDIPQLALMGIGVAWACGLVWVAARYYMVLDEWLSRDEDKPARWPRIRLATIPLLWLLGLILCLLLPLPRGLGFSFLLPALWLSLRRYWRRHDQEGLYVGPGIARIGLVVAIVALPISPMWVFASATLLAWGDDLRRHRNTIRLVD